MYLDELLPTEEDLQRKEESLYLLRQLTVLTDKGKMLWKCTKYDPWEFIPEGSWETAQEVLTHSFDVTASYGGQTYRAEITEGIGLKDGCSSLILSVETGEQYWPFYHLPTSDALAFSSAVLAQIQDSAVIERAQQLFKNQNAAIR